MSTTKTLSEIGREAFEKHGTIEAEDAAVRDAVLAESKVASDVLHASLVSLSMEVTEKNRIIRESRASIEVLAEECRQKDLIIMELRESIGLAPLPAQAPEEQGRPPTENLEDGSICPMCNWTNAGLLNIGVAGKPEWLCHGCIVRTVDSLRAEIERLKGELENWQSTAHMRQGQLEASRRQLQQSQEQVASLDRERDEARTLLQEVRAMLVQSSLDLVGARDSLRHMNSRAESAESRVTALEGELREKVNLLAFAGVREIGYKKEIEGLKKQLAAPAWIPVSTPPRQFSVRLKSRDGEYSNYFSYGSLENQLKTARLLQRFDLGEQNCVLLFEELPQTPPTSPPEEETERKRFEEWAKNYYELSFVGWDAQIKQYDPPNVHGAWLAWQAARQSTQRLKYEH